MIGRWILLAWLGTVGVIWAQPDTMAVRVANLEQDVRLLQQAIGPLRLELEAMRRENSELRAQVQNELGQSRRDLVTLGQLNQRLAALSKEVEGALASNQKATIDQVSKQIEDLAEQTRKAIKTLVDVAAPPPTDTAPVTFNDNFPKTGISYTVQPGDSLGKIAREQNSTIDWIRNANRIAGDLIYPNQQLFIPQKD